MSKPILTVVGTPLKETEVLSTEALKALNEATIIIGENRKTLFAHLKRGAVSQEGREIFFLDPPRRQEWQMAEEALCKLLPHGGKAVLLSDTGMPILFDPGREALEFCKSKGFTIRSAVAATSWGAACSISGFLPPFHVEGFLPQKKDERLSRLRILTKLPSNIVLMDTPYRFELLLSQVIKAFGPSRAGFVAWEISDREKESFIWGSLSHIENMATNLALKKGEFVIIVKKQR